VAGGAHDAAEVGAEEEQRHGGRQQVLHDGAVGRGTPAPRPARRRCSPARPTASSPPTFIRHLGSSEDSQERKGKWTRIFESPTMCRRRRRRGGRPSCPSGRRARWPPERREAGHGERSRRRETGVDDAAGDGEDGAGSGGGGWRGGAERRPCVPPIQARSVLVLVSGYRPGNSTHRQAQDCHTNRQRGVYNIQLML
jgi:hypothetical protein